MEFMKIKIYPEIGDAYYILLPNTVTNIDAWIDENLKFVDSWEDDED